MSAFTPKKFNLSDINGGERFENGQTPEEIAFNAPIEGSAYAIERADEAIAKADQALNFAFGSVGTFSPLTAYPIESVYISFNATSPASLFGGTWSYIGQIYLPLNKTVDVFGNGNALGFYDGGTLEDGNLYVSYLSSRTDDDSYTKLSMSNRGGAFGQTLETHNYRSTTLKSVGVVTNASSSGLTGELKGIYVNAWQRIE